MCAKWIEKGRGLYYEGDNPRVNRARNVRRNMKVSMDKHERTLKDLRLIRGNDQSANPLLVPDRDDL